MGQHRGLLLGFWTVSSLLAILLTAGCEGVLGLGDYTVGGPDASGTMDGTVDGSADSSLQPETQVLPMDSAPQDAPADTADSALVDSAPLDSGMASDSQVTDSTVQPETSSPDSSADSCVGEGGCYSCAPTTTPDFLNACTSSACVPFNDSTRIAGFDGSLPPITTPPVVDSGAPDTGSPDTGSATDSGETDAGPEEAGMVDSGQPDTGPPPPPPCPSTNPVYVTGSSAVLPLLSALAQQLTLIQPPISVVYQKPGSCEGVSDILDGTPITGQAGIGWFSASDTGTACTLPTPESGSVVVDVGVSDVFPTSCQPLPNGLPSDVLDFPGPIQTETFIVPNASQQMSISATAAYFVWGFGAQSGVTPWETNSQLFRRNSNSGTQVMIANGIGVLPVTDWRGIDCGSAQGVVSDVANVPNAMANESIGILALTDLTEVYALQVRVLAYKHFDQDCGYTPSTTPTSRDLANVRNGHYALWGPLHLLSHVNASGIPVNPNAQALISYLDGSESPPGSLNLIQLEAVNNVIPSCAMHVSRTSEIGPISPFAPDNACDCYYELEATGQTSCQSCTVSSTCPTTTPVCSFGYCEPQ